MCCPRPSDHSQHSSKKALFEWASGGSQRTPLGRQAAPGLGPAAVPSETKPASRPGTRRRGPSPQWRCSCHRSLTSSQHEHHRCRSARPPGCARGLSTEGGQQQPSVPFSQRPRRRRTAAGGLGWWRWQRRGRRRPRLKRLRRCLSSSPTGSRARAAEGGLPSMEWFVVGSHAVAARAQTPATAKFSEGMERPHRRTACRA
mmetsp:Transcript_40213/g.86232  ORF Transcript_40213/g.86232 Transcript_40213/m.86232 type:complete len:201 (-) Transcript_40213:1571-2173(-)